MLFDKIVNAIKQFRLRSYRRNFMYLQIKYREEYNLFTRKKIKSRIEKLLSKVQKLGEGGISLEKEIHFFLTEKIVVNIPSTPMYELVKKDMEDRENKPVITVQPNHLRSKHLRKVKGASSLAALFRERENKTIRLQSTLKKQTDKHSRTIDHERFKAD